MQDAKIAQQPILLALSVENNPITSAQGGLRRNHATARSCTTTWTAGCPFVCFLSWRLVAVRDLVAVCDADMFGFFLGIIFFFWGKAEQ